MSSAVSKHEELRRLRAEERILLRLSRKLNEQLNRLKVEELALLSQLRTEKPSTTQNLVIATTEAVPQDDELVLNSQPLLDLAVTGHGLKIEHDGEEEEDDEEEEEEETTNDDLSTFLNQLEKLNNK